MVRSAKVRHGRVWQTAVLGLAGFGSVRFAVGLEWFGIVRCGMERAETPVRSGGASYVLACRDTVWSGESWCG